MVVTILKTTFRNLKSKIINHIINYRKYKHIKTLLEELSQIQTNSDDDGFDNSMIMDLDRFNPRKKSPSGVIMHHLCIKRSASRL